LPLTRLFGNYKSYYKKEADGGVGQRGKGDGERGQGAGRGVGRGSDATLRAPDFKPIRCDLSSCEIKPN